MSVAKGFRLSDDSTAKLDWNYVTKPDGSKSIIEEVNDVKQDLQAIIDGGAGMSEDFKQALHNILEKVAYVDGDGEDYLDALDEAMWPSATSISCVYTQSGTVYTSDSLDSLKANLVVTVTYSDSSTRVLNPNEYTLTGTLVEGTSTIIAHYGNLTTSFTVIVTARILSSITALYTQGTDYVFETDDINSLKNSLVVTATYSDSSTDIVSNENVTLDGTLEEGTSTITVSYEGKTTTFTVIVAGVPTGYTALDYVSMNGNQYANSGCYESENMLSAEYKIMITTAPTSTDPNQHIFSSTNTYYPYLSYDKQMKVVKVKFNGDETSGLSLTDAWSINEDYLIRCDFEELKYSVNDVVKNSISVGNTYSTSNQYTIGTYGGSPTTAKYRLKGRVYYIKLYDNAGVAHYYKPAKRANDDVIGFYDIVTGEFKTSATGTAFTGGDLT